MNNSYQSTQASSQLSISEMLMRLLNGIKKYWQIIPILACVACCAMIMYSYKSYVPTYSATATFSISAKGDTISAYSSNTASSEQLEKTFPYIITSPPLTRVVQEDLGLGYMPGTISASALPETNLFTITATANSYEMAYKLLRSVINNYPEVAEYVVGDTQMVLVVPPSASAEPINAISYRVRGAIATAVGVVVALIIIMMLELFSVTVKKPDDVETLLNSERVGTVVKAINKKSSHTTDIVSVDAKHIDARYKEAVYSIRNSLIKKCKAKSINSFMVTSTGAGEGKTTLSSNLAISFSRKHYRTVIIDCDLRNPSLRRQFNIPLKKDSLGIVDVVTGNCSLEDALLRLKKSGLYVLPGTIPVGNASELMESKQMTELIEALKEMFDYVIVDVPPVGVVSDALEIRDRVGGVLFVVRQDYVRVNKIIEAIANFGGSKINVLGCVFNMASGVFGSRGYGRYGYSNYAYAGYGYGYGRYGKYGKGYYGGRYGYGYGYGYGEYGEHSDDEDDDDTATDKSVANNEISVRNAGNTDTTAGKSVEKNKKKHRS